MKMREIISNRDELRKVIPEPNDLVPRKTLNSLDQHCAKFIGRSPFLILGSSDGKGSMDLSPKGDPPGFVKILDKQTIAIPDRPGNRRVDTMENILENPFVVDIVDPPKRLHFFVLYCSSAVQTHSCSVA